MHGCRDEIADCSERAYNTLSISDAKKLMLFKSDKEAEAYAAEVIAVSGFNACGSAVPSMQGQQHMQVS